MKNNTKKKGEITMKKSFVSFLLAILLVVCSFFHIENVKAATPGTTGENIAYHKNVEVSSTESSEHSGDKAVDADGTTRWSSSYADEQYIIVDLGETKQITGVKLAWEAAYASQYQIQTSTDYDHWTTVHSNYNATGGTHSIDLNAEARYVKVFCIRRATEYGFSLYEFEIYGNGTTGNTGNNGNQDQGNVVDASGDTTGIKIVDANAVDTVRSLFVYLKEVGQDYLLFGHQNDNAEGIVNKDGIISDTYHTVGAYPAITGFEMANAVNNPDYYVGLVKKAYRNHSIPTLCDHMSNFSSGGDTYSNIMPGGKDHWKFLQRLDSTAAFVQACVDDNGEPIPIIYRPFHENSGNWFWWGTSLTKDQFVNLWRFTVEYLRDQKGVHNLLYAYSPNGHFSSEANYLDRYPGDDYVDVIGFDIYHDYPSYSDQWMQTTLRDAQIAVSIANQKGKIPALTEVGVRYNGSDGLAVYNNAVKDWYTRLYDALMNDGTAKQIAYMMTWRNQDKTHFWVPYDNGYGDRHEMADDFIAFYNRSNMIFADRLGNFAEWRNIVPSEKPMREVTAQILPATEGVLSGWKHMEGENARISGAAVEAQSFYSGGTGVGSLNTDVALANVASDWSNIKYMAFTTDAVADGTYMLLIRYNGDNDKTILVQDAAETKVLSVPAASADHAWDVMHTAAVPVTLEKGSNTIFISGTIADITTWLNVDCIELSATPVAAAGDADRYEAEYSVIKANAQKKTDEQSFYSNGDSATNLGSNVPYDQIAADLSNIYYVEVPVYAQEAGQYAITLAFNGNGAAMYGVYRVNGGEVMYNALDNTGHAWNEMSTTVMTVDLQAGMNTVLISGSTTGSWDDWINFDYIDVKKITEQEVPTGESVEESTEESTEESSEETIVVPVPVTGVTAVYQDGEIVLHWEDCEAAWYKVSRSDGRSGYTNLTYRASAAGYTDSNLVPAQLYYYRITGYFKDQDGNLVQGGVSDVAVAVATDHVPAKVTGVAATTEGRQVTLTWDAAEGARYYKVSRAAGATGKYYTMKYNIEEPVYQDTSVSKGTYRYKVVGYYKDVDGGWIYGDLCDTLYVTVK